CTSRALARVVSPYTLRLHSRPSGANRPYVLSIAQDVERFPATGGVYASAPTRGREHALAPGKVAPHRSSPLGKHSREPRHALKRWPEVRQRHVFPSERAQS